MIELLLLCALVLIGIIALKTIFFVFKLNFWALSLPLQVLAAAVALIPRPSADCPRRTRAGFAGTAIFVRFGPAAVYSDWMGALSAPALLI